METLTRGRKNWLRPEGLDSSDDCGQIGNMHSMLSAAMKDAIDAAPCTLRALARQAGVSHSLLLMIRDGDRRCTRDAARKVVAALESWSRDCSAAADGLRQALETSDE